MLARDVMIKEVLSVTPGQLVDEALAIMRKHHFRMLPVVDSDNRLCGELTTSNILSRLVPQYIASGDLGDMSFVPDIGVLAAHYPKLAGRKVADVMDAEPLTVQEDEALLAVAATLVMDVSQHVYALVTDAAGHLTGIISPGDILDHFCRIQAGKEQ